MQQSHRIPYALPACYPPIQQAASTRLKLDAPTRTLPFETTAHSGHCIDVHLSLPETSWSAQEAKQLKQQTSQSLLWQTLLVAYNKTLRGAVSRGSRKGSRTTLQAPHAAVHSRLLGWSSTTGLSIQQHTLPAAAAVCCTTYVHQSMHCDHIDCTWRCHCCFTQHEPDNSLGLLQLSGEGLVLSWGMQQYGSFQRRLDGPDSVLRSPDYQNESEKSHNMQLMESFRV